MPAFENGRESLQVFVLMVQVGTRFKSLSKIAEKADGNVKDDEYSENNIFVQYTYDGLDYGGDSYVHRYCRVPSPTFGFCLKSREVH